jgi:hypothetical protein
VSYVIDVLEAIDWKLPPEPGTTPIPEDHVRLYHQTSEENLGAIKHQGIKISKAKDTERSDPRGIWADEKGFRGSPNKVPTVEFHVHKSRWENTRPFVAGDDVKPSEIIGVHRPWHAHARYLEKDPKRIEDTLTGKHDNLSSKNKDYHHAVSYIKHKYGKATEP